MFVMLAMSSGPPQRPFLRCRSADESEQELEGARGLVRAVRKVPVIARGDAEHPQHVRDAAHRGELAISGREREPPRCRHG